MIDTMDLGETTTELVTSDSLQDKCSKLDVEGELQVSLLLGMIKLTGSGAYLSEEKKSARTQSISLIYKLRTVNEDVMIRHNKNMIDRDVLSQQCDATHVVVAIDWGAMCSVTCKYDNTDNEDTTKVKGALAVAVEKLKFLTDTHASVKASCDMEGKELNKEFTFKCKSDISAPDKELPITFEGAIELVRSLPKLVKNTNNGKGVPVTYHLMPLQTVVKMCKSQVQMDILYKEIDEGTMKTCTDVLQSVMEKRQQLFDIHRSMHANEDFISDQSILNIDRALEKLSKQEICYRCKIQDAVKKVRSGEETISVVHKTLSELEGEPTMKSENHTAIIGGFYHDLNKKKMIQQWKGKGIIYLGKKDLLLMDKTLTVVVLFKTRVTDDLEKNKELFIRMAEDERVDNCEFVVIDQELTKEDWPSEIKKTTINKYVNGVCVVEDLYSKVGKDLDLCLIANSKVEYRQTYPKHRAYVQLKCPTAVSGERECSHDIVNWKCSKCKELLEYGLDDKSFYCKCGKASPSESLFRCNDKIHGMNFVRYPEDILWSELSQHRATNEMNILILGETGVGKSTWINGFQNYLSFDDLNEAMNSPEFHVLIPSVFSFTRDGKETKIQVGERDTNEELETGMSATKEPRSYVFNVGGAKVRLIDTPGIGDCRGIEEDNKNLDNVLSYLTYYDEIHAICILLKPNNSRLTSMFRFCIQELLVQLHSSAKDNIVFCFTNARETFYQPGDTLPALNKALREREVGIQATPRNYFCFDNEPFRFLACFKDGVKFCKADIDSYAKSWDKSVEETKRLFKYINAELKPHKVKDTSSINGARRIILAMSKPLAEVARTIDYNVQAGEKAKKQILEVDGDIKSLEKNLKFSGYDIKRTELEYPEPCVHIPIASNLFQWALIKFRIRYTKNPAMINVRLQEYLRKHRIGIN